LRPKVNGIGTFIKQERMKRGVTQEQLCTGLCNVSTLSRIERGTIIPASFLRYSLLERLGYYSNMERNVFWEESNIDFIERKKALAMATLHRDISEIKRLISECENKKEFTKGIGLQALITSKVVLDILDVYEEDQDNPDFDFDTSIKALREAIAITIPNFDENKVSEYLLTSEEIRCINAMSYIYLRKGDNKNALHILTSLKDNLDSLYVNKYEISWYYPSILINLIWQHYRLDNLEEAIALCEVCMEFCIKYNEYNKIPSLLFIHGACMAKLGKIDEAKFMLLNSYHVYYAFRKNHETDRVAKYYSHLFGEDINYIKPCRGCCANCGMV